MQKTAEIWYNIIDGWGRSQQCSFKNFYIEALGLAVRRAGGNRQSSNKEADGEWRIGGHKKSAALRGMMHQPYISDELNGFPLPLSFYATCTTWFADQVGAHLQTKDGNL